MLLFAACSKDEPVLRPGTLTPSGPTNPTEPTDPNDKPGEEDPEDKPDGKPGDTPDDTPKEGKYLIGEKIEDGENHCDFVFGMAFNPELFQFVEPEVTVAIDGLEPCLMPLSHGETASGDKDIRYGSLGFSFVPESLHYWWFGIQRKGLVAKGTMTIRFKKKQVDYSKFDQNLTIEVHPFAQVQAVDHNVLNINMLRFISIGSGTPLEKQVNEIVSQEHTVEFYTK